MWADKDLPAFASKIIENKKKKKSKSAGRVDPHLLYEATVQSVDANLDFVERAFRRYRDSKPVSLREDFCGTAKLAYAWADRKHENVAWGVDLDRPTLDWGRAYHAARNTKAADRVYVVQGNVLEAETPNVDVTVALNFSYFVFKEREVLRRYFRRACRGLKAEGLLVLDVFGGTTAMDHHKECKKVKWEQASFNAITHDLLCHIHFTFQDGSALKKAYTYDWRLWSIPEIRELLLEAGFQSADVYIHGWTADGKSDHIFRKRRSYENEDSWIAFVVGVK